MAEDAPAATPRMPLHREIYFWLWFVVFLLGVVFYFAWGLSFGVWFDNGVYAVVATMVFFGLAGMWLVSPDPPAPAPTAPKG